MPVIEPNRNPVPIEDREGNPQQQLLNRLQKQYEDLSSEDQRVKVIEEIERMDISNPDREELLRRFG